MICGLRVWGATGLLELDETSFTVRVVHSEIVQGSPGGARTRFIDIPGVTPETHSAVCIPVQNYNPGAQDWNAIQYTPLIQADGVLICYGNPIRNSGPTGSAPQRLLVMRYR